MKGLYLEIVCDVLSELESFKKKEFNLLANKVSSYYNKYIGEIKIKGLKKIRIDLTTKKEEYQFLPYFPGQPVSCIVNYYDFENYFNKIKIEDRQVEVLEQIHENVKIFCENLNFEIVPFEEAYYNSIIDLSREHIVSKTIKTIYNKKIGVKVELKSLLFGDYISILLVCTDKDDNKGKEIEILKVQPNLYFVYTLIDKIKWTVNQELIITNVSEEIQFKISNALDHVELIYNPKETSIEMLKSMVSKVSYTRE